MKNSTFLVILVLSLVGAACGGTNSGSCEVGDEVACTCPGNLAGTQTCKADGSGFDTCSCGGSINDLDGGVPDGGDLVCDDGTASDFGSSECNDCVQCALDGSCASALAACENQQACSDLVECLGTCSDDSCVSACANTHQAGVNTYVAMLNCATCDACPNNCDAETNCGPGPGETCDTGVVAAPNSQVCNDCVQCAVSNECAALASVCSNSSDCVDFANCVNGCGSDQACITACQDSVPDGVDAYIDVVNCAFCDTCSSNCDGACG